MEKNWWNENAWWIIIFSMLLFVLVLGISLVSAKVCDSEITSVRQGSPINLSDVCDNCTQMNVTKVVAPNQTTFYLLGQYNMTKNGTNYYLSYSSTRALGTHYYTTCGDLNGINTCHNICFQVTPSGQSGTSNIVFFLLIISLAYGITIFGFAKREEWVVILGSGLLIGLGLYMIRNGLIDYRDWYTNYLAYATWGVGVIIGLMALISLIDENM